NIFQHFFFLTHENQTWHGIGYLVGNLGSGAGTLYRFEEQTTSPNVAMLATNFANVARSNYLTGIVFPEMKRVVDGVVHLRVRTFDTNGLALVQTNIVRNATNVWNALPAALRGTELDCFFYSNAVPAAVELEIGFLEDRTLERLRSLPI